MKGYKVLKEFVSSDGAYIHKKDSIYKPTRSALRTANLKRLGYIKKIPDKLKTVWDLKEGDIYYSISSDGFITTEIYHLDTQYEDNMRIAIGNAFLTREEAEKELARRKAKQILLRDTEGYHPKRNTGNFYIVCWDPYCEYLVVDYWDTDCAGGEQSSPLNFEHSEDAEASIKAHEKEWKIYLGVEDD